LSGFELLVKSPNGLKRIEVTKLFHNGLLEVRVSKRS
jgi:hypothetical protein